MAKFRGGDRIVLADASYMDHGFTEGMTGTVVYASRETVQIEWDDPVPDSPYNDGRWFSKRFRHLNENAVADDPRTPEKQHFDSVDDLLRKYADKLDRAIVNGTMAYPYSHLGIFAEFLMEFEKLEKP